MQTDDNSVKRYVMVVSRTDEIGRVLPPRYKPYRRYSELARAIYYDYTDQVEPFDLDEAWLDVKDENTVHPMSYFHR